VDEHWNEGEKAKRRSDGYYWLRGNILTNQFSVNVRMKLSWAAQDSFPGSPAAHCYRREAGRNIAIQKISRPFRGSFTE
jgi:hypothetical protein